MRFIQCDGCLTMRKWQSHDMPPGWRERRADDGRVYAMDCGCCVTEKDDSPSVIRLLAERCPREERGFWVVPITYGDQQ